MMVLLSSCRENLTEKSVNTLLQQGTMLAQHGEWQRALRYATEVVKREPDNAAALILQALAYENSGNAELALQSARMAVKAEPNYFQAQALLGRLCLKDPARVQDSIEPLKRALKLRPGDTNTLIMLYEGSRKLGLLDTTKYLQQLAVSKRYRGTAVIQNELGIIHTEHGEKQAAAQCFVNAYKAAAKNPNPIIVLNFAVFFDYYAEPKRPTRALKWYRSFLKMVKNNAAFAKQSQKVRQRIAELTKSNS